MSHTAPWWPHSVIALISLADQFWRKSRTHDTKDHVKNRALVCFFFFFLNEIIRLSSDTMYTFKNTSFGYSQDTGDFKTRGTPRNADQPGMLTRTSERHKSTSSESIAVVLMPLFVCITIRMFEGCGESTSLLTHELIFTVHNLEIVSSIYTETLLDG